MTFCPGTLTPPCDLIQDALEEFGDAEVLEEKLGSIAFRRLMQNRKRITEPIAQTLGECLGSTPQFWLNIQKDYDHDAANCGDLLKIKKGIIGHQVNCRGKMGAGLAKQIAKRYPVALQNYLDYLKVTEPGQALGNFVGKEVTPGLVVMHLFGQLNYGRSDGRCYTDYAALRMIANGLNARGMLIHLPAQMGCGLGGGDWDTVREIFARVDVIWVAGK